ncbi:MAG: hypothetical protein CSA32_03135 [Desulfobulbus propionicus]|nr:MAG: hypothetical protein CSA32_03135 [Desulfobulbus propionicus]
MEYPGFYLTTHRAYTTLISFALRLYLFSAHLNLGKRAWQLELLYVASHTRLKVSEMGAGMFLLKYRDL